MHKSIRKSENLLLSRERAELLWREQRFKAQCPRCYLQIDKNSFHVLGSQYQPQGVHIVLQERNGKRDWGTAEEGTRLCKGFLISSSPAELTWAGFNELKHLQRQRMTGMAVAGRNSQECIIPELPQHFQGWEGARPPPMGAHSPLPC